MLVILGFETFKELDAVIEELGFWVELSDGQRLGEKSMQSVSTSRRVAGGGALSFGFLADCGSWPLADVPSGIGSVLAGTVAAIEQNRVELRGTMRRIWVRCVYR
jgi:hypothetical protein